MSGSSTAVFLVQYTILQVYYHYIFYVSFHHFCCDKIKKIKVVMSSQIIWHQPGRRLGKAIKCAINLSSKCLIFHEKTVCSWKRTTHQTSHANKETKNPNQMLLHMSGQTEIPEKALACASSLVLSIQIYINDNIHGRTLWTKHWPGRHYHDL